MTVKWMFISGILHFSLLGMLSVSMKQPARWPKHAQIYHVELIESMKAPAEEAAIEVVEEKTDADRKNDAEMIVKQERLPKPVESLNTKIPARENAARADANESGPKLSIEGEVFPHSYYLATLKKRIEENWRPPVQEVDASDKLNAIVRFRIQRDGEIDQIRLEKATDRFLFDQAAQRAVFNLGRMPPLPPEFPGGHIIVHVEFETTW